jgi:hypothetical protein
MQFASLILKYKKLLNDGVGCEIKSPADAVARLFKTVKLIWLNPGAQRERYGLLRVNKNAVNTVYEYGLDLMRLGFEEGIFR